MLNYFYNLSSRGSEGQHPSGLYFVYVLRIVIVTLDWII